MTEKPRTGRKLLYFFRGPANEPDPLAATLAHHGWDVRQVPVSDFAPFRGLADVFRRRDYSEYDVVAAAEYHLVWLICLRLIFSRNKPKIAAFSFNQSRRLLRTGILPIDWALNRIWRRASLYLVHSRDEATLFARIHDIPRDRFIFSHWGFDLPARDPSTTTVPAEPYVTMIGRNNRDLSTFCQAVERAGVKGVLVTARYMLERCPVESPDVLVLADRPMEECLNFVAGSFAHLVLVTDADRGAGHISSVSAMLLGKPQIFSDVPPLKDYLTDGFNGLAVPVGDAQAVAAAIRALRDNIELGKLFAENGRRFALEQLSYDASAARVVEALESLL